MVSFIHDEQRNVLHLQVAVHKRVLELGRDDHAHLRPLEEG